MGASDKVKGVKSMNRKRPKQIVIRMDEQEYEKLKGKVEKSGMSQQEYLIKCVTGKQVQNTDGLKIFAQEIKRIGVNLNQITKSVNEGKSQYSAELEIIQKELSEVWQLLRQSIQKQV